MFKHRPGLLFGFLMLIFLVPLGGAWYAFKHHLGWIPKTTNYGTFVRPVLPLQRLTLSDYNYDNSFNIENWQGYWILAYVKGENCDQTCLRTLYEINQIRVATGKFQDHILTAYIAVDPNLHTNPSAEIFRAFPRTILLKTNNQSLLNFLNDAPLVEIIFQHGQLLLIDPQGFVMMRYNADTDPENIYHDLNHLLGVESI